MSFGGFGGGAFGSNNNNNTNNRPSSLFGGGSSGGFGSNTNTGNTGFGTSSNTGFGTNNTSGGGLFGSNNNNNSSSGVGSGGFGSNNANNAPGTTSSLFGGNSNNASTGGGLFGNTTNTNSGAFGSSGTGFGSNNANTSTGFGSNTGGGLFGNKSTTPSTGFGNPNTNTGGGLFGGGNTPTTFGSNSNTTGGTGFGTGTGFGAGGGVTGQNPGTGGTPFQSVIEADGPSGTAKVHYQSIAFQEPYKGWSFQELRQQDYDQGRRFGNEKGQAGAFGAAPTFGGTSNNTATGGFGSGSTGFGGGTGFGTNNNTNAGFGASTTTGFGSTASGGLFGNNTSKPASSSLFGTATTSAPSGGGLFGNSTSNNNADGAFGSSNTGGGLFGGGSNTGFGTNTGGFGASNTSNNGGLFRGNQAATAQPSAFGGGFGQQQGQQTSQNNTTGFGAGFGANNSTASTQPKSLFGNNNTGTGSSLFGNNNQPNNQPANPSPFGASNNQNTTGGLFGPKPTTGTSLFGGNNNTNDQSGGLFGNNNNNNNQQAQPATSSLFGGQPKPRLFGNSTANNNTGGGGLFGNSTNNNNTQQNNNTNSLFGNSNNAQPAGGNSLFGNSQPQQFQQSQQPQQLLASVSSTNPYGHDQLFANLGTTYQAVGPLATPLSSSQKPRRPAPLPAYKLNPAASSRLITPQKRSAYGYSYSTYGTPGSSYGSPSPYSGSLLGGSYGGRSLNKSLSVGSLRSSYNAEESILNPNAFSPSARSARGTGSMKRLQINRNLRTDLFGNNDTSDGPRASPLKKAVSFDDQGTDAQHANGQTSSALVRVEERGSATPTAEEMGYLRSSRSQTNDASPAPEMEQVNGKELATVPEDGSPDVPVLSREQETITAKAHRDQEDQVMGAYWMSPKESQLKRMTRPALSALKNFTVGRVGAGQIQFDLVDLTSVKIDEIAGGIVVFKLRSASVYPDHLNKPQQGKGLNVPATVTLANSWPRSHGGRVKVFDKKGPKFEKHLQRMKRLENTEFINYNADNGEWTFRVEHFSSYELDYGDGDSILSPPSESLGPESSPLTGRSMSRGQHHDEDVSMLSDGTGHDEEDTFEFRRGSTLPGLFAGGDFNATDDIDRDSSHGGDSSLADHNYEQPLSAGPTSREQVNGHLKYNSSPFGGSPTSKSFHGGFDGQMDGGSPRHSPPQVQSLKPKSILKVSQQPRSIFGTPSRSKHILDEDNWAEQLQRTLSPKKQNRQALRETQGAVSRGPKPSHGATESIREERPFTNSMDIMNSLYGKDSGRNMSGKHKASEKGFKWPYPKRNRLQNDESSAESGKLFHSSLKPSWSLDSVLHLSAPRAARRGSQHSRQGAIKASTPFPLVSSSESFEKFRELSTIQLEDGAPRASLDKILQFADFASRGDDTDAAAQNEEIMWQLAQILFDDQDPDVDEQAKRKQNLTQFWKSIVTSAALEHAGIAKTSAEKGLAQLSAFDVWGATETLLKGGNPRLATMIAQIGGDESMRTAVAEQIQHWRDENDIAEIPSSVRALYELLAGNTCVSEGKSRAGPENKAESFNISSKFGLDWRRAFGLKLWYGITDDDTIGGAVELYEHDLSSYQEKTLPLPRSVPAKETGWKDPTPAERQDVLWGLLKLYAFDQDGHEDESDPVANESVDIKTLLDPASVSGHPLSARLSFQLYHTLAARCLIRNLPSLSDSLTQTLATQLSASPRTLVPAIFTLTYLSSSGARKVAIKALLTHHVAAIGPSPDTCSVFRTLSTELKVPTAWIYNAKAIFERAVTSDRAAQALNLLRAGEEREAHEVLVRVVAPVCVIEERVIGSSAGDLKTVLEEFEESEAVHLPGWKRGGGLYSDFVCILERAPGVANDDAGGQGEVRVRPGSQQDLRRLCKRVRGTLPMRTSDAWKNLGLEERVACEEMRDVIGRVETALEKLRGVEGASIASEAAKGPKAREDDAVKVARQAKETFYTRFAQAIEA